MLITCSGTNEKVAVQDSYKILNRYAEEELPELEEEAEAAMLAKRAPEGAEGAPPAPRRKRPFQQMRLKAKAMLFIAMSDAVAAKLSPHRLSKIIFDDIAEKKMLLTRFCSRMYPIEYCVDASLENFQKYAAILVERHFPANPPTPVTWCVKFKCRSNSKFTRIVFLDVLLGLIPEGYQFLQYKGTQEFFVDITQHTMCLSVLSPCSDDRYYSFQKAVEMPGPKPPAPARDAQDDKDMADKPQPDEGGALKEDSISNEDSKSDIDMF